MENMNITIRDARQEDARDIAGLIVHAWPVEEFLRMKHGMTLDDFITFLQQLVAADDTLYSYKVTKVAVLDSPEKQGRVVGMMNGYDGALYRQLKQPVLDAITANFDDANGFGNVIETEAGEFYLDSAGVDPSMRSKGIGSMLFKSMLEKAASSGFRTAGLIVDEDKPKAEALYERLGFRTVGYRDFLGHRMKHMQKEL